MNADCPFCLANNKLKSSLIAQSGEAFLTNAYNFEGCYLIVPKSHIELLSDLPDDWWAHFKQMLASIPDMPEHYNLSLNYGKPAGQTLPHLHFWIVPRKADEPSSGQGLATLVRFRNQAG